jgi:hypothetical protein
MSYHQNAGQNHDTKIVERNPMICGTVQIFGNLCDENSIVVQKRAVFIPTIPIVLVQAIFALTCMRVSTFVTPWPYNK